MVSVVVPSYANFQVLLRCVDSVRAATPLPPGGIEIAIVSSACTSSELESLRSRDATVILLDRPAATSESRNIGAKTSSGELLLFLDDDNVVAPEAIWKLSACLESWPDAVLLGPAMYFGDAPTKLWCAGVRRSRVLMKTTFRRELPAIMPERMSSEDFPNCFMVRRNDFEHVGGFDASRFPQQWEEGDLARRLVNATGGSVYVVPGARVWHYIDMPLVRRLHLRNPHRAFLVARGRAMFTAVHGDRLQWAAYIAAAQWIFGAFYLSAAALSLPRGELKGIFGGYLRGMLSGVSDGWRARALDRKSVQTSPARAQE